jgi:peptidoglycan/xylan/chitin deacetylase (PgdA/CDA1 family)
MMLTSLAAASLLRLAVVPALALPPGCDGPAADSVRVPILVYHQVVPDEPGKPRAISEMFITPDAFEAQMRYLRDRGIHVVSLGALVEALQGRCTLPSPVVVLTFDDGRDNQYRYAFPILRKYGFTATFFPFTHAMDRNPRYLTWAQLREMQEAGMTIGSHTHLHVRVDKVTDPAVMHKEVTGSRDILQNRLGAGEFLAYPFGALSAAGDSAARAAGYRAARAFSGGPWNSARDLFRLHAIPMTGSMTRFRQVVDPGTR